MFVVFFFFKQKTAYELRISDWSSDVCSSDLGFQAEFDIGDLFLSAYLIGTEIGTLAGGGRCGELTSRGYAACGIGAFKQRRVWRACAIAPARDDVQQRIITQPVVQADGPAGLFSLVADDAYAVGCDAPVSYYLAILEGCKLTIGEPTGKASVGERVCQYG